ncbi:hypothetical protein COCC4DRAFT_150086 [Bipolaris maydis ATCC 48331]|uniref:Rhodopsin domain-containing protein n=2 Tax=Cochliobolus heterostrophus TaxID=5016 RepID=M2V9W8_COCH5|nr:uncharacterized protein COCC4DRAFT_150086 [Bipolaris maydis ATCC 48331]EMD96498.1 hypothetical protein COCHEDRAFT_1220129 [Bipolaris maydis C5]KAH7548912.1 hypothetical protein BM1_10685 [Bipolaris maydis]ENI00674.1 hypothetical protein COCC4DRAFT_150086 [Bipolaris maydis ATCC 48331]KAJ5031607.1 hypothetical protein J3E73DRAFT_377608 [Bipolaris maydis]KAJ5035277.1 hypothetical protein J3E74DRAFT_284934 [Bipolaris maydis]
MSDNLKPAIIGVNITLILLTLLAISCRVGRRFRMMSSFSWHDALAAYAAFCAIMLSIILMASTHIGGGLTLDAIPPENITPFLKMVMASLFFYFMCNWAVKHSLLCFYSELTFEHSHYIFIYVMHVLAFMFGFSCVIIGIFQCLPVQKFWNNEIEGFCIDTNSYNYYNSIFMLLNDIVLYIMPVIFTWNVHLHRSHRIAVNCLFALGGLVLGASAARVYFVDQQAKNPDFPFRFASMMICSVIENHLAVIVSCAPNIKALILLAFPSLSGKFDKIVSDGDAYRRKYKNGYKSNDSATLDVESSGIVKMKDVEVKVEKPERPGFFSSGSSKSGKTKDQWWLAPNSWAVESTTTTITSSNQN